jgi:hypothetical protein
VNEKIISLSISPEKRLLECKQPEPKMYAHHLKHKGSPGEERAFHNLDFYLFYPAHVNCRPPKSATLLKKTKTEMNIGDLAHETIL